jgi:hypothetical protein
MDLTYWLCIINCAWLSTSVFTGVVGAIIIRRKQTIILVPPLAHFTYKWAYEQIMSTRWIKCHGSIFAVNRFMYDRASKAKRTLGLLVRPRNTRCHVNIPAIAQQDFRQSQPLGVYTLYKYLNGHFYANYRRLNIDTGKFARGDERRARLFIYMPDILVYITWVISIWACITAKSLGGVNR